MKGILDTPIVIDLLKPKPSLNVQNFFSDKVNDDFFVTVFTVIEIRKKIELLPGSSKKKSLEIWLTELIHEFQSRILSFELDAANYYEFNLKNIVNLQSHNNSFLQNLAIAASNKIPIITLLDTPLPSLIDVQIINLSKNWDSRISDKNDTE